MFITSSDVSRISQEFVGAWNRGDLEGACEIYAPNAIFITPQGITCGREAILHKYKSKYNDPSSMGLLSLGFEDFRLLRDEAGNADGSLACAVFKWELEVGGKKASGYAVENWGIVDGRICILMDASM